MANKSLKIFFHFCKHQISFLLTQKDSVAKGNKFLKECNPHQSYYFTQRSLFSRAHNLPPNGKKFQDRSIDYNENSLFYQLLKESNMYICAEQIFKLNNFENLVENGQDRFIMSLEKMAQTFQHKLEKGQESLAPLIAELMKLIASSPSNLNNETILLLMYCLVRASHQIDYISHALHIMTFNERECIRRLPYFSMKEKILAADILIQNSHKPSLRYLELMVKSEIAVDPIHVTIKGHEFAQIMYYFNIVRCMDPHLAAKLTPVFKELLPTLTTHQLVLVCAGFFKTNNPIRDQALLIEILERLNESLPTLLQSRNLPYLNMLLKTVRSGLTLQNSSRLVCQTFLESLTSHCYNPSQSVDLPLNVLAQAAWLATNMLLVDPKFIGLILARLQTAALPSARFKDITKLIWCLGSLNPQLPNSQPSCFVESALRGDLGEAITNELCSRNRVAELDTYQDQLCVLLYSFSLCGYYPERLFTQFHQSLLAARLKLPVIPDNSITTPFVTASRSKVVFDLDDMCLSLYASLQIERPSFYASVKHPAYCDRLSAHLNSLDASYLSQATRGGARSSLALTSTGGSSDRVQSSKNLPEELYFHLTTQCSEVRCYKLGILPHSHTVDLYVTLGNVMPQPLNAQNIHAHLTRQPHILLLPTPYLAYNSVGGLTGRYNAKIRQLKLLGYDVRLIPWYEWHKAIAQGTTTPYLSQIIRDHLLCD